MATVFAGCVFSYDEDKDLSQVILEIAPFELTYEVPLTVDYIDPFGNPVRKLNDGLDEFGDPVDNIGEIRNSADFGEPTDEIVQTVRRTHDGAAIHKAKIKDGKVVYIADVNDGDTVKVVETVEGDENWDNRSQSRTNSEYFVEPVSGEEYRFDGIVYSDGNSNYAAKWTKLSDGKTVYGALALATVQKPGSFAIDSALPLIDYDASDDTFGWTMLTPAYETATYKAEGENFYKSAMMTYFNNYAQSLVQQGYKNVDDIFNRFINMFSTSYLSREEAIAAIKSGDAEWGVTEINTVNRTIYDNIDSELNSIYTQISLGRNENVPEVSQAETPSPTYPTPPTETPEDSRDYKVWNISQTPDRIPGNDSNPVRASFERAAMRNFVKNIKDYVEDQYAMSEEERKNYRAEVEDMEKVLGNKDGNDGASKLYARLYTYDIIRDVYADSTVSQLQTTAFRNYLGRDIQPDDVATIYDNELASQRASYNADVQNYYTACSNNETILYFADQEYFWVKHILIPFSDAQTANLEAEKARGKSDAEIEKYRENLGKNVVVYKHKDGENDTSRTYTIAEAYSNIESEMQAASSSTQEALTKFDELIYTYNTDPGIFNNEMGYAITATPALEGGAAETYMIEFATAARDLYKAYKNGTADIGSISEPVLTDYGWHILCLNFVPQAGQTRVLGQYLTAANITKVDEALAVDNYNTKLDAAYTAWQSGISEKYRNMDSVILPHKERFKGKLKEYEEQLFTPSEDEESE